MDIITHFKIISRSILLRIKINSGKSCRENQNAHNFQKHWGEGGIVLFMRYCGKMLYSQAGHNANMQHAHCMLQATNKPSEYAILIHYFATATIVARTRLNVTFSTLPVVLSSLKSQLPDNTC
jgi:hypothetical protein